MTAPLALLELPESPVALLDVLTVAAVVLLAVLVWQLSQLLARAREVDARLSGLDRLEGLDSHVRKLAEQQGGLDLRRLEHVLIDLRDGQRRLEERLLAALEARGREHAPGEGGAPGPAHAPSTLGERVVTRLLAMGYERIEVLTPIEELEQLADGDVVVEARKGGALHKGRVSVRAGVLVDVKLRPPYQAFP